MRSTSSSAMCGVGVILGLEDLERGARTAFQPGGGGFEKSAEVPVQIEVGQGEGRPAKVCRVGDVVARDGSRPRCQRRSPVRLRARLAPATRTSEAGSAWESSGRRAPRRRQLPPKPQTKRSDWCGSTRRVVTAQTSGGKYQRRQIEADEFPRAVPLFDIPAEEEQDQHIADNMPDVRGIVDEPAGQELPPHPGPQERIVAGRKSTSTWVESKLTTAGSWPRASPEAIRSTVSSTKTATFSRMIAPTAERGALSRKPLRPWR